MMKMINERTYQKKENIFDEPNKQIKDIYDDYNLSNRKYMNNITENYCINYRYKNELDVLLSVINSI